MKPLSVTAAVHLSTVLGSLELMTEAGGEAVAQRQAVNDQRR